MPENTVNDGLVNLPNRCCRCLGDPEATWEAKGTIYEKVDLTHVRSSTRTVKLPICTSCGSALQRKERVRWIILAVCAGLFLALSFVVDPPASMGIGSGTIEDRAPWNMAAAVWGFVVGLIPAAIYRGTYKPVAFTTDGLRFKNRRYQELYDKANP